MIQLSFEEALDSLCERYDVPLIMLSYYIQHGNNPGYYENRTVISGKSTHAKDDRDRVARLKAVHGLNHVFDEYCAAIMRK